MESEFIKVDIWRELLWYATYKELAERYPFASKDWVVNKTNEYVKKE